MFHGAPKLVCTYSIDMCSKCCVIGRQHVVCLWLLKTCLLQILLLLSWFKHHRYLTFGHQHDMNIAHAWLFSAVVKYIETVFI
jgi:hypothetical protein